MSHRASLQLASRLALLSVILRSSRRPALVILVTQSLRGSEAMLAMRRVMFPGPASVAFRASVEGDIRFPQSAVAASATAGRPKPALHGSSEPYDARPGLGLRSWHAVE